MNLKVIGHRGCYLSTVCMTAQKYWSLEILHLNIPKLLMCRLSISCRTVLWYVLALSSLFFLTNLRPLLCCFCYVCLLVIISCCAVPIPSPVVSARRPFEPHPRISPLISPSLHETFDYITYQVNNVLSCLVKMCLIWLPRNKHMYHPVSCPPECCIPEPIVNGQYPDEPKWKRSCAELSTEERE